MAAAALPQHAAAAAAALAAPADDGCTLPLSQTTVPPGGRWVALEERFIALIEGSGTTIRDVAGEISSMLFTPVEHAESRPPPTSGKPGASVLAQLWDKPGLWWQVELLPSQTYMCVFRISGCLESMSMDWILSLGDCGRQGTVARGGVTVRYSGDVSFRGGYRGSANHTFAPLSVRPTETDEHPQQDLALVLFVQLDERLNLRADGMVGPRATIPSLSTLRPAFGTAYASPRDAIARVSSDPARNGEPVPRFLSLGAHFLSLHCALGAKVELRDVLHWERLEDNEQDS